MTPFPAGDANGAYQEEKNKELNKLFIDERHTDIIGPIGCADSSTIYAGWENGNSGSCEVDV